MHRFYAFIFSLLFLWGTNACGETPGPGESLTLAQAIEIGLKNQPTIKAGISTVKTNEAKIGETKAGYYPQLSLNETYTRSGSSVGSGLSSQNSYGSTAGPSNEYVSTVTMSQLLYDFGKTTNQVNVQRRTTDSARSDLDSTMNLVVFNIKQAYFNLLQGVQNRDVAQEAVSQFEEHLKQAKAFYEVGTKPKFDVTKAEVDLSNAKLALIKAENQVRLARVTLNNAMGLSDLPRYTLADKLSFDKFELPLEKALQQAYTQSADLRSIMAKKEAAKENVRYYEKGYYPVLTGSAGFSHIIMNDSFAHRWDHDWNLGASLTFPIFSGFQTKYQVAGARSTVDTIAANELSLRLNIQSQLEQAYLNLREAGERITTTELIIRQAKENLDLANGRYDAGVGSPVDVTDAVVAVANAQVSRTQALYDYKVAGAGIEKIVGGKW